MVNYHFESNGLFLGFLSYPYYVDGRKDIYGKIIKPFFKEHRKRLNKYDICDVDKSLYKPAAYRMFGSQGLVVLSLIDDYSFCSRHFNKNHIRTLLKGEDINEDCYKFKSIVVTGVTEVKDGDLSLNEKANNTFLRKNAKYPFVGIIRLKIDHRILLGEGEKNRGGIKIIRAIKEKIHNTFKRDRLCEDFVKGNDVKSDYLVIDCFDNDEMTIIAFSNSIKFLMQFLGSVRNIKSDIAEDKEKEDTIVYYEGGEVREKHIFSYTYIGFGYDVDEDDTKFLAPLGEDNKITLNCLIETRPGHRDTYWYYLKNEYKNIIKVKEKIASGGSVLKATIELGEIHKLESLCKEEITIRDVRKMRVSLQDPIKEDKSDELLNHAENLKVKVIDKQLIEDLKNRMKSIGISKIVRDRLLALFELYDSSRRNLIQTLYFEELSGIVGIFSSIIEDLDKNQNIDIKTIEYILDSEITNMESACYDRIHNRKYAENLLEYSGGIQQHLTAFGYAYNRINNIISGAVDNKDTYTIITGADRVSSERTHLNLNINHILFPELFVTTAWKEVSNKSIKVLGQYPLADVMEEVKKNIKNDYCIEDIEKANICPSIEEVNKANKRFMDVLATWHIFAKNESSFAHIKNIILQETHMLLENDETYNEFKGIIDETLLLYFINDYVVSHFAFQRDFEKIWYFNFKILLQTTNCYQRLGKIKRKHLIYMLLRLFMIGLRLDYVNKNGKCKRFIQAQMYKPFDSVLQEYWFECYKKTYKLAKYLLRILNDYGFIEISEYQVSMCERNAEKNRTKENVETIDLSKIFSYTLKEYNNILCLDLLINVNNKCITERKKIIDRFENCFEKNTLIDNKGWNSFDFLICLLSSFVSEIYNIDSDIKGNYYPIKSIPRNANGEIIDDWKRTSDIYKEIYNNMINILCDTTGGFFLPLSKTRKQYFALRTVFYRSLWNYRMNDNKILK